MSGLSIEEIAIIEEEVSKGEFEYLVDECEISWDQNFAESDANLTNCSITGRFENIDHGSFSSPT
jgi:hypothetical protein